MGPVDYDERSCLFLDVDGTLIDIAQRPEAVVVPQALVAALEHAAGVLGGAVALVSGRTVANLDELFRPLRLSASGVHGAEVRVRPDGPITFESDNMLSPDLSDAIRAVVEQFPGALAEDKRFSIAVHFRLAPQSGPLLRAALDGLVADAHDPLLRILPGHMVFEIKRATFDKGLAVRRLMAHKPFAGRIPLFFGDDVTDRPGFAAAVEQGGQAYSVGQTVPGTSGSFPDPAAVRSWLAGFASLETNRA